MRSIRKIALMAVGDASWQGGIQYIVNIIHALHALGADRQLEVHLFKRAHQRLSGLDFFSNIKLVVHDLDELLPPLSLGNRVKWFLDRKLKKQVNPRLENYLLLHEFDYVYPATVADCNKALNAGSWIADFQYHNFPDGHDASVTLQAERTIGFIANEMPKVVFSSIYCEQECFELFPAVMGKTHVMPFAVFINPQHISTALLNEVRDYYKVDGPYLMVSNLFAATKNHKTLFEALGILRKEGLRIKLVCTGNLVNSFQTEYTNEVLEMISAAGIHDQVYLLGLIPRAHQISLYRMAVAMVQPSLHEGWSTCVEEAKALGKTLILSDIGVHREQWPDNPFFFEPTNSVLLAKRIKEVYQVQHDRVFPDLATEKVALEKYEQNVKTFGENFLKIASL